MDKYIFSEYKINLLFGILKLEYHLTYYRYTRGGMIVMPLSTPRGKQEEVLDLLEQGYYVVLGIARSEKLESGIVVQQTVYYYE